MKGAPAITTAALGVLLGACQTPAVMPEPASLPPVNAAPAATDAAGAPVEVLINDANGVRVGVARLSPAGTGVQVMLAAAGLPPGMHGFHIHETGRCDPPGFQSAGGHFAPLGTPHGFDVPNGPHAGDMRNIEVGTDGQVRVELANPRVTLGTGPTSLFDADGSALVIHAQPDDYRSQPSGDAGARIACGVIARG